MASNTTKSPIKATVFIPTFNGEEFLEELLRSVTSQKCPFEYEVLIIDSGSRDETLNIIARFPSVRLHQIPNSEFGHGKTRNLAAKMAEGEIVVYLTQDAIPASSKWLEYMVEPFLVSEKIYCAFGKQIPRPTCVAPLKREIVGVFNSLGPDHSLMVHRGASLLSSDAISPPLTFFSDVNSAVRRELLLNKIPFRDVSYSEDQALGADVLKAGFLKVYTPSGAVFHSHNYPPKKYFHRKYDEYVGLRKTIGHIASPSIANIIRTVIKMSLLDYRFIFRDSHYSPKRKIYNYFVSPLYNIELLLAMRIAAKDGKLAEKLSLESRARKPNIKG